MPNYGRSLAFFKHVTSNVKQMTIWLVYQLNFVVTTIGQQSHNSKCRHEISIVKVSKEKKNMYLKIL